MISIIIYSTLDGTILRTGLIAEEQADLQCGDNEAWLEGAADDATQMIDLATLTVVAKPEPA